MKRLADLVGADHVEASGDEWCVRPGTEAEVAAVVRAARRNGWSIVAEGRGQTRRRTDGTAPARPTTPSEPGRPPARIVISLVRLCHVVRLDDVSLLVHVQAGMAARDLEAALRKRGLSLGDYPPTFFNSSIGGVVAVRTPGKSSARHGPIEDLVVGLSAVLPDGTLIATRLAPRRATGPDVIRALAGAEGALGVVTSVVLRVVRYHEAHLIAAYVLPSMDAALRAAFFALREEVKPAGLRIHDHADTAAHFPDVQLAPEEVLMMTATGGASDMAVCDRDLIASAAFAEGGRAEAPQLAETWWQRVRETQTTPVSSVQVLSSPSRLAALLTACRTAAETHGARFRCHVARFDFDGAVAFVTIESEGVMLNRHSNAPAMMALRTAATEAGGYLFGARLAEMDVYFAALRAELDPGQLMGAGAIMEAL